jgi:hypothetical protein
LFVLAATACGSPALSARAPVAAHDLERLAIAGYPEATLVRREGDPRPTVVAAIDGDEAGDGERIAAVYRERLEEQRKRFKNVRGDVRGAGARAVLYLSAEQPEEVAAVLRAVVEAPNASSPSSPPAVPTVDEDDRARAQRRCLGAPQPNERVTTDLLNNTSILGRVHLGVVAPSAWVDRFSEAHVALPRWSGQDRSVGASTRNLGGGSDASRTGDSARLRLRRADGASPVGVLDAFIWAEAPIADADAATRASGVAALAGSVFLGNSAKVVGIAPQPSGVCVALRAEVRGTSAPDVAEALSRFADGAAALFAAPAAPLHLSGDASEAALAAALSYTRPLGSSVANPATPHVDLFLTEGGKSRGNVELASASTNVSPIVIAFEQTRRSAPQGLATTVKTESGQSERVFFLGDRCGTQGLPKTATATPAVLWGAIADGLALQGWDVEARVAPDAAGLLLRGSPRPGETPELFADRVAVALRQAVFVAPPPGSLVHRVVLRTVAERATAEHRAFAALAEALAPSAPGAFDPQGALVVASSTSAEAVGAAFRELPRQPLAFAALVPDPKEAERIQAALAPFTARGAPGACPRPSVAPPSSGLHVVADAPSDLLLIAAPLGPLPAGEWDALATVAERLTPLAAHALPDGAATAVDVRRIGSSGNAALAFAVRGPAANHPLILSQLRAFIARVRGGAVTAVLEAPAPVVGPQDPRVRLLEAAALASRAGGSAADRVAVARKIPSDDALIALRSAPLP